jgi:uncharacterized protein
MLQQEYEKIIFAAATHAQSAPAQRLTDFVDGIQSATLPKTSYIPGVISAPLHEILPPFISERLKVALKSVII